MNKRCNNCFELFSPEYDVCPHCGYVDGSPAKEIYHLYPGTIVNNRYIIGEVLGFGGFGITYKVWDQELETVLAIKEYYPSGLVNRVPGERKVILFTGNKLKEYNNGLERFLDEARHTAQFNSERNIIHVFDYFEENNTAYFVMEFLDGMSLKAYFESIGGKMPVDEAVNIAVSICEALKKVHSTGYIHRDISADNIFICSSNRIVLYDFGAARFSTGEEKTMSIILKPGYAPPEQYRAKSKQGPWTDIYALGATIYNLITGLPPDESINRTIEDTVVHPIDVDESIPQYISDTIMKAMAINYNLRFENVQDFQDALEQNKKVIPVEVELKNRKRKRAVSLIAAVFVVCFASVFCWNLWREPALQKATLNVYIINEDSDEETSAKLQAYQNVFNSFVEINDAITINVKSLDKKYYNEELEYLINNGEAPSLFESTSLNSESIKSCQPLSGIFEYAQDDYYFLSSYKLYFGSEKRMPLGFVAPVIYINKTKVGSVPNDVTSQDAIKRLVSKDNPFVIDANMKNSYLVSILGCKYSSKGVVSGKDTEAVVGSVATVTSEAVKNFYSGNASILFSNTSNYYEIRDALPQRYKLVFINSNNVLGSFTDLWSIGAVKEDELKAAQRLLLFMLSAGSQDYLHIQRRGGSLPLNIDALNAYFELNPELKPLISYIEKYKFIGE